MLTKTNYNDWYLLMRVKLQARQLWDAVVYEDAEYHEDRLALDAILASVPPEMISTLADKPSAKHAWDSLAASRVDIDRARKATMQKLRREWDHLSFRPGEDIDDFALHLSSLMQQLARHGDTDIDELKAVEKYLRVVPSKYAQVALSIETLLDLSTLSIEEVTGRLKAVDDRDEGVAGDPVSIGGKLLFTEEQWLARQKERKKKQDGSSSSKDARQQPRKKGGSGDKPSGGKPAGGTEGKEGACGERKAARSDTCLNCGRRGHWARDCR
jgi:hypothetical protein